MHATYENIQIDWQFLDNNPNTYFVFGDDLQRQSKGKTESLRDHPHALGFITKKFPDESDESFYRPEEYSYVFFEELEKLTNLIKNNPTKTFYVSKLGGDLSNKYFIWERLIRHNLIFSLCTFNNVVFCWRDDL